MGNFTPQSGNIWHYAIYFVRYSSSPFVKKTKDPEPLCVYVLSQYNCIVGCPSKLFELKSPIRALWQSFTSSSCLPVYALNHSALPPDRSSQNREFLNNCCCCVYLHSLFVCSPVLSKNALFPISCSNANFCTASYVSANIPFPWSLHQSRCVKLLTTVVGHPSIRATHTIKPDTASSRVPFSG